MCWFPRVASAIAPGSVKEVMNMVQGAWLMRWYGVAKGHLQTKASTSPQRQGNSLTSANQDQMSKDEADPRNHKD